VLPKQKSGFGWGGGGGVGELRVLGSCQMAMKDGRLELLQCKVLKVQRHNVSRG